MMMVSPDTHSDGQALPERATYRTVFISDTHLGSRAARSRDLAAFLEQMHCEKLYLVGDIIDFWRLGNKPYWPPCHHRVLRRILKLVQQGTQVIFVPGNHDEAARRYCGMDLGGVQVMREDTHETVDGRRMLVVHGDEYDLIVNSSRLLNIIGGTCYEWLVTMNRHYNNVPVRQTQAHTHVVVMAGHDEPPLQQRACAPGSAAPALLAVHQVEGEVCVQVRVGF